MHANFLPNLGSKSLTNCFGNILLSLNGLQEDWNDSSLIRCELWM